MSSAGQAIVLEFVVEFVVGDMSKPWFKHYDPGVPETIAYPEITIEQALHPSPDTAIVFRGNRLTYADLDGLVDRMGAALQQLGVAKGDRVAIHLPNCPQFVIGYYAALRIGAIAVPCNPAYVARELAYQLCDSGAEVLITLSALYGIVCSIRDGTFRQGSNVMRTHAFARQTSCERVCHSEERAVRPGDEESRVRPSNGTRNSQLATRNSQPMRGETFPRHVILVEPRGDEGHDALHHDALHHDALHRVDLDGAGPGPQGTVSWFEDLLAAAPARPFPVDKDGQDTAVLMYTGGTTGISKGAQLTHRNLVANAAQFAHWVGSVSRRPIILTALPLFHSYAMTVCMNHAIYAGGTSILVPDPRNLEDVLETIQQHRPTIYPGVPATYVAINNSPQVAAGKYNLRSIEACISGGAPLPESVRETFQRLTGAHLVEGYGLSEASPVTHVNPLRAEASHPSEQVRPGSIGLPLPDTEARVMDIETGTRTLLPGEAGELCVRGPQVMKGYWNMPAETAHALRDGWLYTGDIAVMDEDGYFQIIDRKKDVILGAGGLNVYPREIEEVLYQHPKVQEAVAAGVPMGEKGERVKVWIVLKEGQTATESEIMAFCQENLAPYKRPSFVAFRDQLPKTMVGKVLRRALLGDALHRQEETGRRET